jgi:hypothetical protein
MAGKVDRYERSDLPERQKAALRLADLAMADPMAIGGELRARLEPHFTPAEIVELAMDVVAWSKQKIPVALGVDAAVDPERVTLFEFDEHDHAVVGGARVSG